MQIHEIPNSERPREKVITHGIDKLSNRELLAIIIRVGYRGKNALDIGDEILRKAKGMRGLPSMSMVELMKVKGIKEAKAIELLAVFELAKRCYFESARKIDVIDHPEVIASWLQKELGDLKQEHFMVVFLDVKNQIISSQTIFVGGLDRSIVHPREIFKEAFSHSAAKLILVHNHPSQDVTPSPQDIEVTNQLVDIATMMNIPILDHVIVSRSSYFSFRQHNLIE